MPEIVKDGGTPPAPPAEAPVTPPADTNVPPEGISQEDWNDLSQSEREGFLDTGEELPPSDNLTDEKLAEIIKEGEAKPPVEEVPVTPPVVPPVTPPVTPPVETPAETPPAEITDEDLLRYRPAVSDSEIQPVTSVPSDLQDKLDELKEELNADEITREEYDEKRDAINRSVITQNLREESQAKTALVWTKEQEYFLKGRPIYLEKTPKGDALFGALNAVVKSLDKDPKYASATGIELLVAADRIVRKEFGIGGNPPAPPESPGRKPAAPLPTVKTLADIPSAAPNTTDGPWAGIDRLQGQAYEDALERMSPEQRDQYMNSR